MNSCQLYSIFHLNLAFSSIDESEHKAVIERCYWPLLEIIEKHQIPLGIELTSYTLEAIEKIEPSWLVKFSELLNLKKCELLASGDSQIIGPLIPAEVNLHNLRLGQLSYQKMLNVTPQLAYINEQAVSSGLLDIYIDAGFEAVIMEWDNPYSYNPDWQQSLLFRPQSLETASGRTIKVIWNHAITFQKFQRFSHGEITRSDFIDYLIKTCAPGSKTFPMYGSDAEVFDYRPSRFHTETCQKQEEWTRINALFSEIKQYEQFKLILPSDTLKHWRQAVTPLKTATAAHPVSVKKQSKYNITRWAVTGRNDLQVNSLCYKKYYELMSRDATNDDWKQLCRMWASDIRTHITETRYEDYCSTYKVLPHKDINAHQFTKINTLPPYEWEFDSERNKLDISSPYLHITLNLNRGMSIEKLAFLSNDFFPVCGTLAHGYFDHINFGADYYSNHLVMERFREHDRVTDLNICEWELGQINSKLVIQSKIETNYGILLKRYKFNDEAIECSYHFTDFCRPEASLRLGFITLLNCDSPATFACHNGGYDREYFTVTEDINHGAPVSSIVSANTGLGATEGEILFGNKNNGVLIKWNPAECAAIPMVSSKKVNDLYLNRLWFSLIEADETLKPGGFLPDFKYCILPWSFPE